MLRWKALGGGEVAGSYHARTEGYWRGKRIGQGRLRIGAGKEARNETRYVPCSEQ